MCHFVPEPKPGGAVRQTYHCLTSTTAEAESDIWAQEIHECCMFKTLYNEVRSSSCQSIHCTWKWSYSRLNSKPVFPAWSDGEMKHCNETESLLMVSSKEQTYIYLYQWGEQRQHLVFGVDSLEAQGREGVWGLPGHVLDTAALLREGQLSAHVCRPHIRELTQLCASGWQVSNLVGRLMKVPRLSPLALLLFFFLSL